MEWGYLSLPHCGFFCRKQWVCTTYPHYPQFLSTPDFPGIPGISLFSKAAVYAIIGTG